MKVWKYGKGDFSKELRKLRAETGMSQAELAKAADLDQGVISQYERGIRNPSIASLIKIASALEVDQVTISIKGR